MRNLRAYLDTLYELGHVKSVEQPIDWSIEASALTATSCRDAGPALHFKNIKGYPGRGTLAGGLFAGPGTLYLETFNYWTRPAIALGLGPDTEYPTFLEACVERLEHPILPIEIDQGPAQEQVFSGEAADATKLPFPLLHAKDGGRYGTLETLVVRDIDSGRVVWENVRSMIVDGRRLAVRMEENSEAGRIFRKYQAAGRAMPVALVVGAPPSVTMTGFLPPSKALDPAAIAGGLNLDPIELVRATTSDLFVPCEAEVVIEGTLDPTETVDEGPFPDYWIYKELKKQPLMNVTAITHRSNPVIPFSVDGVKPSDTHVLKSLALSVAVFERLRKERNFQVRWVQLPLEFNLNMVVICTPILFPGYVGMLSKFALSISRPLGSLWNKVAVVDERTPAHSLEETIAIMVQRSNPKRDYHIWAGAPIGPNARYASQSQASQGSASGLYIDTAWPNDWAKDEFPRKCDLEGSYPKGMIEDVVSRYNALGFEERPVVFQEALVPF